MRASLDWLTAEELAAMAVACNWTHTSVLSGDCSQNSKRTGWCSDELRSASHGQQRRPCVLADW